MAKSKKKLPSETESAVICPIIRNNDEPHLLEDIFKGPEDEMPVIKSVGYMRLTTGVNSWVSYTITTQGERVLKIEVDEPNVRAIAEESAKTAFVTSFVDQEAF